MNDSRIDSPVWARRAAHAVAWTTLPSGLWRVALGLGLPVGYSEQALREDFHIPGWGVAYVIGLSVLSEALALLTLGLVSPWGEVAPSWIPFIGGKRVAPKAAVIPAAVGSVLLFLIWDVLEFVQWSYGASDTAPGHPTGGWKVLQEVLYLPLLAWGPLLAAVTMSYHRRHK
ncbi:hypothetical protein [Actinomadura oligospora]|uniref:hypothetical protein n=1 Tax=Actinomadura oligospora TaxID=111804 RepID=UPI0009FF5DCB|nr:hypothetical protein [Actinomadura oligospora]